MILINQRSCPITGSKRFYHDAMCPCSMLLSSARLDSTWMSRETAATFCTGAPLPGVTAAPPNWVRVADQILLSPLGVDGLDDQLVDADKLRASDPAAAADVVLIGSQLRRRRPYAPRGRQYGCSGEIATAPVRLLSDVRMSGPAAVDPVVEACVDSGRPCLCAGGPSGRR